MGQRRVGVLGSGAVGQVLAKGFAKHGYATMIGTREPAKLAAFAAAAAGVGTGVAVGTFDQAARFGELLVLAVKGAAAEEVLRLAGAANLDGKVVLDTTNPIDPAPPVGGVLKFFTSLDDSLMERLQRAYPAARFVKAWSSVGNALMVDPVLPNGPPTMFLCGDDPKAREEAVAILREFGWDTEELGGAAGARAIEPLCILWCIPGFLRNDWARAYKVLRP